MRISLDLQENEDFVQTSEQDKKKSIAGLEPALVKIMGPVGFEPTTKGL